MKDSVNIPATLEERQTAIADLERGLAPIKMN
jgi:hypothetical protein